MADNSAGGQLITQAEYTNIRTIPVPDGVTQNMTDILVRRLNGTIYGWDQGVLEGDNIISHSQYSSITQRILNNTAKAKAAGYGSITDWYSAGYDEFDQAEEDPDEGVCAKVRIQIQQRLAITREAFRARLELENGESQKLSNIKVEIEIHDSVTKKYSNMLFSISKS